MKKVSIIMGVYNEEKKWLKACMDSLLNQTYTGLEIIVILDNPNNKEIRTFIENLQRKDARIKFFINEKNLGLVKTLNKAIKISSGDYIARMDADDISCLDRIEKQVCFLDKNDDISMVGTKIKFINEESDLIRSEGYRPIKFEEIKRHLKYFNAFAHPTLMFRRNVLLNLKGYREILYAEDYDLVLRLITNKYKCCNLDYVGLKYRIRENGISVSKADKQLMVSEYLRKYYSPNQYEVNVEEFERYLNNENIEKIFSNYIKVMNKITEQKSIKGLFELMIMILKEKEIRKMICSKKGYSVMRKLKKM